MLGDIAKGVDGVGGGVAFGVGDFGDVVEGVVVDLYAGCCAIDSGENLFG